MPELREQIAEALYRKAWPNKQCWLQALPQDREEFLSQADTALSVLIPSSEQDTLPEWLYWRFSRPHLFEDRDWQKLDEADKAYWAHQAAAVRRAVVRGGFKETT
ncbi:hypothetical protein [Streptomyces sp. NPDC006355]|uniref:hypothetical protein n=1 Tax=Streptomyces sp. NPDC006355 TaxID=3156758 RepID=UPI0033B18529